MIFLHEKAYAKINLYLHVTGKRQDGYHLLDSLAVFPEVFDELNLTPAREKQEMLVSLTIKGPFATQLSQDHVKDNLIVKAAHKLAEKVGKSLPHVALTLEKNLPVASGIGGGSSDAAAALRLLLRYWDIQLSKKELHEIALSLGADVPVCLDPITQRMQGIGEGILRDFDIPPFGMILVNHGEAISTAEIFKKRKADFSHHANLKNYFENIDYFIEEMSLLNNDLQQPAISVNATILEVLKEIKNLPHCRLARMSGSGATCFGLFNTVEQAVAAANLLSQRHSWWIWAGKGMHSN